MTASLPDVRVLIELPPGRHHGIQVALAVAEIVLKHPGNQPAFVVVGGHQARLSNKVDAFDPTLAHELATVANCDVVVELDD